MGQFALFCLFFLIPTVESAYKYEDFQEENVRGLQEFLSKLDEETQELVVELLEAKEIQNMDEQDRMMGVIMRKQNPGTLDNLIRLYKQTMANSSRSSVLLSLFPCLLLILF